MKQGWNQVRTLADLLGVSVFLCVVSSPRICFVWVIFHCVRADLPSLNPPPFSPSQGLPHNLSGQLPQNLALLHLTRLGLFFLFQVKL